MSDLAPIRLLKPPTELTSLQPDAEDGYYHVRTPEGAEGWVWGKNVKIQSTPTTASLPILDLIDGSWDKPTPNKTIFAGPSGTCGFAGQGDETEANWHKDRTDMPTSSHDVSFFSIAALPYPRGPKNRSKWTDEELAPIHKFEGVAVRVVGFLAAVKPQAGSSESTNCYCKTATETDWHVALVEKAGDGDKEAVVVETSFRIRRSHPKWTKARLQPWIDSGNPARISG